MRQPLKIVLAVVLAAGIATGCGSDDESPSGDSGGSDAPKTTAQSSEPPKRTSARGKMVTCMQRAGFEVTHKGQDAATATNYTVEGDDSGSKKADIVIHPNRDDAERSSIKAGEEKGINAVAFGRAEFIRHESTDREAGTLANCIAGAYAR